MVWGYEKLRIAKGFQRANTQDNLLSGLFGGIDLPIELLRMKPSWFRLYFIPVGSQADQLKWIAEQFP